MGKRTNTATWSETYNRWQINVQKSGERRSFYSSTPGRNGQREANRKADEWLDEGILYTQKRLSAYADEWLEDVMQTTSLSNYRQYFYNTRKWIKPRIGNVKMEELTSGHIQSVINNAYAKGKLSKKSLENIRACMVLLVKYGRKYKATTLTPTDITIPSGAVVGEREILTPEDLRKLITADKINLYNKEITEPFVNAFRLEVVTGLRPGETLGLQWDDITGGKVNIKRSISIFGEITKGKNKNAQRSFALTPLALDIIAKQMEYQNEQRIISDWIFPGIDGEHATYQKYKWHWDRYRTYNSFATGTTLYELRHTFVSINKKLPQGYLKQLVGHSKDMDTYGIYSHEIDGDAEQTAALVQKTFSDLLHLKEDEKS